MKKILLLLTLSYLLSSCAYVLNQGTQNVKISSELNDVKVIVNGKDQGKLPINQTFSRCHDYDIILEKAGYKPKYLNVQRQNSFGWTFYSAFMTGYLGLVLDQGLCSLESFKKTDILVDLDKK